ncbi:MAG: hypothetical protein P1P65_05975 [Treponema sp.]
MNALEKFYTDSLKMTQKMPETEFRQALRTFFTNTIRSYDKTLLPLAEDVAAYWLVSHQNDSREAAAEWFYAVFSLFDGSFTPDMDFSDEDWEELHVIVSAAADELDIHTIQSIMGIMVERHKL